MNIGKYSSKGATRVIYEALRDEKHCHQHGHVDPARTKNNIVLIDNVPRDDKGETSSDLIKNKIKELGVTRKIQSNANLIVTTVVNMPVDFQLPTDWKTDKDAFDDYKYYFATMLDAWCQTTGISIDKVLYATVHMDEDTPHMHIGALPVFEYTSKPNKKTGKVKQGYRLSCDFLDKKFLYNFHPQMQKNAQALFNESGYDYEVKLYDKELIDARHQAQNRGDHSLDCVSGREFRAIKEKEQLIEAVEARLSDLPSEDDIKAKQNYQKALNDDIEVLERVKKAREKDNAGLRYEKAELEKDINELLDKRDALSLEQQRKHTVELNAFSNSVRQAEDEEQYQ